MAGHTEKPITDEKQTLLDWVERDRDRLIDFFSAFIRAKSPNPPGDTREAAAVIERFLADEGLPYRVIAPQPTMPNIVASFDGGAGAGRHLVLNGHIDVFPADRPTPEGREPFSGDVQDGRIYGRGACDMKAGTAASMFAYAYLHKMRDKLRGRLTFTAVSDEETFGPWGTQYLLESQPDAKGDCCLNGEPSSEYCVVFGERGILWLKITVRTEGTHGAYAHRTSLSAVKVAIQIIAELEKLSGLKPSVPEEIVAAMEESDRTLDRFMGEGSAAALAQVHVNIGRIQGGLKVNMMPSECVFEADLRLPIGIKKEVVMAEVERIVSRHPNAAIEVMNGMPPSWSDPKTEMVEIIRANVRRLKGYEPSLVISPGGTDCRLWRYRGVPAYSYGPSPLTMATVDEWVEIDDFLHVVRTHALSAYDYLKGSN